MPYTRLDWFAAAVEIIRDAQPDTVVVNGDLFDADGFSTHGSEPEGDWLAQARQGNDLMAQIRGACKRTARREYLQGNHDERLFREGGIVPSYMRKALYWRNLKGCEEFENWEETPYLMDKRGIVRDGPFLIHHGVRTCKDSDHVEALEIASLANRLGGCVVRGHTHSPMPVIRAQPRKGIHLNLWVANTGTFCDTRKMRWTRTLNTEGWEPRVLIGEWKGSEWRANLIDPR